MESLGAHHKKLQGLRKNLTHVIRGKDEAVDLLLAAMLANGSVLFEDVPGMGKTTLAKALAKSVSAVFNRIQFTPDLLPGDILGSSIYNPVQGTFTFRQGPVFANFLLADEINRASPRTQSALMGLFFAGLRTARRREKRLPHKTARPGAPEMKNLLRLRKQADRKVRRCGFRRAKDETVSAFAQRISRDKHPRAEQLLKAAEWYRLYNEARFRYAAAGNIAELQNRLRSF